MKKRFFVMVGILFLVLGGGAVIARSGSAENEDVKPKKTVKAVPVSPAPFRSEETFSGFVRGARQSVVSAKTSGYITRLLKEEGDTVRRGETIAVIDGSDLAAAEASAIAVFESVRETSKETKRYYEQKIEEAEAALERARDEHEDGNASEKEVDLAEESLKSAKRLRDAQVASAKAEETTAKGVAAIARENAGNIAIKAPFDGVIAEKRASLGSFLFPGSAVYVVASEEALEVAVSLPGSVADGVANGSRVKVSSDGLGDIEGHVFSLSQTVGETQRSRVRIRFVSDTAKALRLGEHVSVVFPYGDARQTIFIPQEAIIRTYDDAFVFVIRDGRSKKTAVTLGENVDGRQEILSGLSEGTHVVVEGGHGLDDDEEIEERYEESR